MTYKYELGVVDLIVIVLSLVISTGIAIYVQYSNKQQKTTEEFLLAGRGMSKFPVIISIAVTLLSTYTMLSHAAEIYRFGLQRSLLVVSTVFGAILSAIIFIPVYFQTKVSTTNEFLEIRFGRTTRFVTSTLFTFNMIIYMSIVLYAPAMALNAVTNLSIEISIIVIGLVCTLYCTIGGLRAVMWTDVFQAGLIFLCFIIIYAKGIYEAGGISQVYKRSHEGQRLEIFNMSFDLTTRYTFWNVLAKGTITALANYGTSQLEVQRMLSTPNLSKAKTSLYWGMVPVSILLLLGYLLGLILYSIFYLCDPVLNEKQTGITKYDQIVPYYIVSRLNSYPGLTGLCIAGIFSGSLSGISSTLNSLSTVTVVDFIKPLTSLSDRQTFLIAKGLSASYGILCILLAFVFKTVDSLAQIKTVLQSVTEGPVLAVFFIAVLSRRTSEKSLIFGLFVGVVFSCWTGYGSVFGGNKDPSLPLSTSGCPNHTHIINETKICTDFESIFTTSKESNSEPFFLYKISFLWISLFGCLLTLFCVLLVNLITGWNKNVTPANPTCLSPITKLWLKMPSTEKTTDADFKELVSEERNS